MRVVCPNCSIAYDVPGAMLAGRKAVRCARCKQEWRPGETHVSEPVARPEPLRAEGLADADVAVQVRRPVVTSPPELTERVAPPTAMQRLARDRPAPPGRLGVRIGWTVSVLVLVLLVWSAIAWRADVTQAWPPSARLYSAIGLSPSR